MWDKSRALALAGCPKPLVVAGDGRNDSPGYCAKYLTYTFMDVTTKKIVELQIVDCRESGLKSGNMEKIGFQRGIKALLDCSTIKEIVTDAHPQIKCLMSE